MNVVAQIAGQLEVVFEHTQCLGVSEMLYGFKLFFRGGEAQGANLLAQKSDIRVVKEGFGRLNEDVIFEKDVKEDAQFLK